MSDTIPQMKLFCFYGLGLIWETEHSLRIAGTKEWTHSRSAFLLHCCCGVSIKRTARKELFETKRHWIPSLDNCHAALMSRVCVPVYILRNLLYKMKEWGRERRQSERGERPYVTWTASANWTCRALFQILHKLQDMYIPGWLVVPKKDPTSFITA